MKIFSCIQGGVGRRVGGAIAFASILLFAAGCDSEGLIKAKGKIIKGGSPIDRSEYGAVVLILTPDVPQNDDRMATYPGNVKKDGSFEVTGHEGKGIPPGTYKFDLQISTKGTREKGSQLTRLFQMHEVTGSDEIIFDMDKGSTAK